MITLNHKPHVIKNIIEYDSSSSRERDNDSVDVEDDNYHRVGF